MQTETRPGWALKVYEDRGMGGFAAELPFRRIVFFGSTQEQALANLVRGYCELARSGAFNPVDPEAVGVPPIQHVLSILGELLAKNIAQRESNRTFTYDNDMKADDANGTVHSRPGGAPDGSPTWGSSYAKGHTFARDNEVISGLATAIAALARVKEL